MTSTHICQTCSDPFTPSPGAKGLFCSPSCAHKGASKLNKAKSAPEVAARRALYYANPSICTRCKKPLDYSKRKNKFCSSSCAATFNNTGRTKSVPGRLSISHKIIKLHVDHPAVKYKSKKQGCNHPGYKGGKYIPKLRNCIVCNKEFVSTRKTCSRACMLEQNRRTSAEHLRKNRHKYVGPHQRSYMERTFVAWLEAHGITKGVYGYWDQVHFKHKPHGKVKNGWADFVFVSRRLIIELDGSHHKTRKYLDAVRDSHLTSRRGYKVIRITHSEYVKQTRLKEIEAALGL